mgnify:CR=1 FL=1
MEGEAPEGASPLFSGDDEENVSPGFLGLVAGEDEEAKPEQFLDRGGLAFRKESCS